MDILEKPLGRSKPLLQDGSRRHACERRNTFVEFHEFFPLSKAQRKGSGHPNPCMSGSAIIWFSIRWSQKKVPGYAGLSRKREKFTIDLEIKSKKILSTARNRPVLGSSWRHNQTIKIRKPEERFYIPWASPSHGEANLMRIATAYNLTSNSKTNGEHRGRRMLRPELTRKFFTGETFN